MNPGRTLSIYLIPFLSFVYLHCSGQAASLPCSYWPAPCPNAGSLDHGSDRAGRSKDNIVLTQELDFEAKCRNNLQNEMMRVAKQNNWRVYEFNENTFDGPPYIFISYEAWENTPYSKRPAKRLKVRFAVILNRDSLQAWREWTINDLRKKANENMQDAAIGYKEVENDQVLKMYVDSMMYYGNLRSQYAQEHMNQYTSDIKNNNEKGIKAYEKMNDYFLKKTDAFQKKYEERQNKLTEKTNTDFNSFQQEAREKTSAFADGSLVLVEFYLNPYLIGSGLEDGDQRSLTPQQKLAVPGSFYAGLLKNTQPYDHFSGIEESGYDMPHPNSIAFILLGSFTQPDGFNNYRSLFTTGYATKQQVIGEVKKTPCDVLQTMGIHIKGRPDNVKAVMEALNIRMFEDWLMKKP